MAKPDPVFSPYLKARLRTLKQPKLLASAGIFALSAFVLVRMFVQPDAFVGTAADNRDGAANLEANANLSPEERAIAAELDDIAVLLTALEEDGASPDALLTPTNPEDAQRNLEAPDLDLPSTSVDIPSVNASQFQSLPLLDLNPVPESRRTATLGQSNGFVGFNSVSGDPTLNLPTLSNTLRGQREIEDTSLSPLEQALNRYAPGSTTTGTFPAPSVLGSTNSPTANGSGTSPAGTTNPTTSASTSVVQSSSGVDSAQGNQLNQLNLGGQINSQPQASTAPTAPTPAAPNAFTQLQNPQFSVPASSQQPATLQSPTLPQTPAIQVPVVPAAQPQFGTSSGTPQSSTGQFSGQFSGGQFSGNGSGVNNNAIDYTNPAVINQPNFSQAPGTPVYQQSPQNNAVFSVPNRTPGQNIGGGRINTFSNP